MAAAPAFRSCASMIVHAILRRDFLKDIVLIIAFIRTEQRVPVEAAIRDLELTGWSESISTGHGRASEVDKRLRLEIMVPADRAAECSAAIVRAAHTGKDGDGFVLTVPVLGIERISNLTVGPVAL